MTQPRALTCPQCGGAIEPRGFSPRVKCSYCGTEQILAPEVLETLKEESWAVCPVCKRNDRLEKVSAIAARGYDAELVSLLALKEPPYYDLHPPQAGQIEIPPRSSNAERAFTGLGVFVFACVWLRALSFDKLTLGSLTCMTLLFIAGFLGATQLVFLPGALREESARRKLTQRKAALEEKARREFAERVQELERRKAANAEMRNRHHLKTKLWRELYYCFRDDVVCLPAEGLYAPAQEMENFLDQRADNPM